MMRAAGLFVLVSALLALKPAAAVREQLTVSEQLQTGDGQTRSWLREQALAGVRAIPGNKILTSNDNLVKMHGEGEEEVYEDQQEEKIKARIQKDRRDVRKNMKRFQKYQMQEQRRKEKVEDARVAFKTKYSKRIEQKTQKAAAEARQEERAESEREAANDKRRQRAHKRKIKKIRKNEEEEKHRHERKYKKMIQAANEKEIAAEKEDEEKTKKHRKKIEEEKKKMDDKLKKQQAEHDAKLKKAREKAEEEAEKARKKQAEEKKKAEEKEKADKKKEEAEKREAEKQRKVAEAKQKKVEQAAKQRIRRQVYVFSAGFEVHGHRGGRSYINVGNRRLVNGGHRGMNIVLLNNRANVKTVRSFDTYGAYQPGLVQLLRGAQRGDWIIVSCKDECIRMLRNPIRHEFWTGFGARRFPGFRGSYILVAQKGTRKVLVEQNGSRPQARAARVTLPEA